MLTIEYETIEDLARFREQYDKLTGEIQQARVQLENSPPLAADSPKAEQRAEWRSWLQLQIVARERQRTELVNALVAQGYQVNNLPE
ncbi:hypothetical protein [Desulfobulbus alkaliphilus]|uniref:hypothetical protein n=1 Tax=Desulfobulbus alkaliphilus TaxID=869814 RepID=UPI001964B11E|nr:hypothetical protein [Desulfobulbus alkaliphilus]MBM9536486.1 hypothetical protein [Desulfobulbus alkaliphilus]